MIGRDEYGNIFQNIMDGVESGRYRLKLDRTFSLADVADAHRYMANLAAGKVVGDGLCGCS